MISAEIGRTRKDKQRAHHEYVCPVTGPKALWQKVIGRAIRDCFMTEQRFRTERNQAVAWLFRDCGLVEGKWHNFKKERAIVCDAAEIDFDFYRDDLFALVKKMEGKQKYMGRTGRMWAKSIVNMMIRRARAGPLWQEVIE